LNVKDAPENRHAAIQHLRAAEEYAERMDIPRLLCDVLLVRAKSQLNNHRLKPVGCALRTESPDTRRLNDASTPAPS
jgi:hypothetical protein